MSCILKNEKKIIITGDGIPSIFIEELKETYHSKDGAAVESDYVYLKKGLAYWLKNNSKRDLKIFEMGLGAGLNAYLSYVFALEHKLTCEYFSVEKYPLTTEELQTLDMKASLPEPKYHDFFVQLHQVDFNKKLSQSNFFQKIKEDFLTMTITQKFDIIFYDAFGYHAQSEL